MREKNDLTILVLSCDKYSDLWKPLFYCMNKFWNDCPYPVYLGSNTVPFSGSKIPTLLSGPDKDWSSSLLSILAQIKTPYIFLWLDDIFPVAEVGSSVFDKAIEYMKKNKGVHMHMQPKPVPDVPGDQYGVYAKGAPYRVTALGLWNVSYLKTLLLAGESPWNFEIMGSYRSSYTDGFYCSMTPLFSSLHVVEKGGIFTDAYAYCKKNSIPLDTGKRKVIANTRGVRSFLQKVYFNLFIKIPWRTRLYCMNILRKLFISY